MFKFTKKRVGAVVAVGALAIGVPVAYSYWTEDGSGEGTASTGDTVAVTVNQTGDTVRDLFPGGPVTALSGDFDNPNDGPVHIDRVTVVVDPDWSERADASLPACDADDFTIGGTAPVESEIASGDAVGSWSGLTLALKNTSENQDNCKGVTVDLDYTAHAFPAS